MRSYHTYGIRKYDLFSIMAGSRLRHESSLTRRGDLIPYLIGVIPYVTSARSLARTRVWVARTGRRARVEDASPLGRRSRTTRPDGRDP